MVPVYKSALIQPVPSIAPVKPFGSIPAMDAAAILNTGMQDGLEAQQPIMQVLPVDTTRSNVLQASASNPAVTNTAIAPVPNATGAGIMAWVAANPMPALVVAGAAAWLIYELSKSKR